MAENSIRNIERCVYSADGNKTYCGMDRGGHLYADHFFRQAQSESEFDKTFRGMEGPNHPATCDNCGKEGTNSSLENHLCANEFEGVDMAENAPETIRLIRDNNGLFRSGWYYPDAAVGPHHSAIHYTRADLAVPAAAQIPKTNYKNKRQLTDSERFKLNKALNEYAFNNCDHEHDGYPNHLVCRWCVLEILAAIQDRREP